MYYDEEYHEVEYFDAEDYEEARRKDSAELHQKTVQKLENRYGCNFPEFILRANTSEEMSDLLFWSLAIRYLARYEERIYS